MPARSAGVRRRVVAVLLAVSVVAGCSDAPGSGRAAGPTATPTATQSDPVQGDGDTHQSLVPPIAKANQLVNNFATVFVRKDLTDEQWWNAISPLCERGLALELRKADRRYVPALEITGPPKIVVPPSPAPGKPGPEFGVSAEYQVPLDNGVLIVTIEAVGGQWLVFAVDHKRRVTT
jgi:hypothetical protein